MSCIFGCQNPHAQEVPQRHEINDQPLPIADKILQVALVLIVVAGAFGFSFSITNYFPLYVGLTGGFLMLSGVLMLYIMGKRHKMLQPA